jgi:GNAT superfamily N-acetyltransferase
LNGAELVGPEPLNATHEVSSFDCGVEPLNDFLQRHAKQNERNRSARTFVVANDTGAVRGFYSLCAASVGYELTPERVRKGLARHDVPLVLLARLAVDKRCQGMGLGSRLLLDAFGRFLQAQETIGARALLAHAKDDSTRGFYLRWGFVATEGLPFHLYLLTKDIEASLSG